MAGQFRFPSKGRTLVTVLGVGSMLALAGCAITPEPFTDGDVYERVQQDRTDLYQGQEPLSGAIGLGEAVVRSVHYNLDNRVKMMELAVAMRDLDFSKMEMLPDLVAEAGYNKRSNDPGARSINLETGEESLPPSRSQERETITRDLDFMWNLLDFGISYHSAHQKSDEVEIVRQRQRKTIHNIVQDVVDAYWKAWVAQKMEANMDALLGTTESAIARSTGLAADQSMSRKDALAYQTELLRIRNSLYEIQELMRLARIRLAALINIPPESDFKVLDPSVNFEPSDITRQFSSLADNALLMRPELREEDYRKRISQREVKKTIWRLFPRVQIGAGYHADENAFLINDDWTDVSLNISWNILGLFGVNAEKKFREAQIDLADTRRLALSMAVMTQVKLATERYEMALLRYRAASQLSEASTDYAEIVTSSEAESELDKIKAGNEALISTLKSNFAYAEAQSAFARVVNSVGVDLIPSQFNEGSISGMGSELEQHWAALRGSFM